MISTFATLFRQKYSKNTFDVFTEMTENQINRKMIHLVIQTEKLLKQQEINKYLDPLPGPEDDKILSSSCLNLENGD